MINVSFVGCGGMAAHYLGVYRDLDWVRVVNCIDAVPDGRAEGRGDHSRSRRIHRFRRRRWTARSTR